MTLQKLPLEGGGDAEVQFDLHGQTVTLHQQASAIASNSTPMDILPRTLELTAGCIE